jgi:hypothetical protein
VYVFDAFAQKTRREECVRASQGECAAAWAALRSVQRDLYVREMLGVLRDGMLADTPTLRDGAGANAMSSIKKLRCADAMILHSRLVAWLPSKAARAGLLPITTATARVDYKRLQASILLQCWHKLEQKAQARRNQKAQADLHRDAAGGNGGSSRSDKARLVKTRERLAKKAAQREKPDAVETSAECADAVSTAAEKREASAVEAAAAEEAAAALVKEEEVSKQLAAEAKAAKEATVKAAKETKMAETQAKIAAAKEAARAARAAADAEREKATAALAAAKAAETERVRQAEEKAAQMAAAATAKCVREAEEKAALADAEKKAADAASVEADSKAAANAERARQVKEQAANAELSRAAEDANEGPGAAAKAKAVAQEENGARAVEKEAGAEATSLDLLIRSDAQLARELQDQWDAQAALATTLLPGDQLIARTNSELTSTPTPIADQAAWPLLKPPASPVPLATPTASHVACPLLDQPPSALVPPSPISVFGLSNATGQNACYVNVICQSLANVPAFSSAVLAASPAHSAGGGACGDGCGGVYNDAGGDAGSKWARAVCVLYAMRDVCNQLRTGGASISSARLQAAVEALDPQFTEQVHVMRVDPAFPASPHALCPYHASRVTAHERPERGARSTPRSTALGCQRRHARRAQAALVCDPPLLDGHAHAM